MTDSQPINVNQSTVPLITSQPSDRSFGNTGIASGASLSAWTDWCGIVVSVACAIHCAAMPLVIASLPAMGLTFLADASFHKVMAVACSLLAGAAFVPGWRRHRRLLPIGVAAVGLLLITTAAFAVEADCCPATPPALEPPTVEAKSQKGMPLT